MHLTTGFLSNGIKNGGLLEPDTELLGDFAINTATQDYFFIEENNGAEKGGIDFKNLKPEKAYKFYVFTALFQKFPFLSFPVIFPLVPSSFPKFMHR